MDDFRKYATKHLGMNSLVLDDVINSQAGYLSLIHISLVAAALSSISTNAMPLKRPVARSMINLTEDTVP